MSEREGSVRVVLYERSELPPPAEERADSVHDRLRALADGGDVGAVERAAWAKRVPVGDCEGDLRDRYLTFTAWADRHDVRLTPFFQTRECFSPEEGGWADWLVLPAFCLAVYRGESVAAVYPHADGAETRTVEDGLRALRGGDVGVAASERATAD